MDNDNLLLAFFLTALAGLSTGIGSAIAFFTRRTSGTMLALAMGLSAGVMLYVSFSEMLPESISLLASSHGELGARWLGTAVFFGGMALAALIDRLVPEAHNPHAPLGAERLADGAERARLERMGLMTALAIAIHKHPEGVATFAAALQEPAVGLSIAVAVAIHNIPEGIAVSVPIFYATGSRRKAFGYSFLSGLSEPVGALLGYLLLSSLLDDSAVGVLLAGVAGIMVFISLDELFPAAREYGQGHLAIYGTICGMAVMALSLLMLG